MTGQGTDRPADTALHAAALAAVVSWPAALREDFEERAAIMEFDGKMSRTESEIEAWRLLCGRV